MDVRLKTLVHVHAKAPMPCELSTPFRILRCVSDKAFVDNSCKHQVHSASI